MKKILFFLVLAGSLIVGCETKTKTTPSDPISSRIPEPDLLERLRSQKTAIDTLFIKNKDQLKLFAQITEDQKPLPISGDQMPEDFITTYSILKDDKGHLLAISEFPNSISGDWYLVLTHYFDHSGKTFAFERQANFFNSLCTEGAVYETRTHFFDADFKQVDQKYRLTDEQEKTLPKDSCQFPYTYESKIMANVKDYLTNKKIEDK